MRILFLTCQHLYLYNKLLPKLAKQLQQDGCMTAILLRNTKQNRELSELDIETFHSQFYFGREYFESNNGLSIGMGLRYYLKFLDSLRLLKREIISILADFNPDIIVTPNSYDISLNVIKNHYQGPIYYIQHSNIMRNGGAFTSKKRFFNILNKILVGVCTYNNTEKPPFSGKRITYLLWTSLFADNIFKENGYEIRYLPRIIDSDMYKPRLKDASKKIHNVMVILNKRSNIGKESWRVYADFYKHAFMMSDLNIIYKVHPSEDFEFNSDYFCESNVVKGEIDIDSIDLVITHWSSFAYDAALQNIPMIMVNPHKGFDFGNYRMDKYSIFAYEPGDISRIIKEIDNNIIDTSKANSDFIDLNFGDWTSDPIKEFSKIIINKSHSNNYLNRGLSKC